MAAASKRVAAMDSLGRRHSKARFVQPSCRHFFFYLLHLLDRGGSHTTAAPLCLHTSRTEFFLHFFNAKKNICSKTTQKKTSIMILHWNIFYVLRTVTHFCIELQYKQLHQQHRRRQDVESWAQCDFGETASSTWASLWRWNHFNSIQSGLQYTSKCGCFVPDSKMVNKSVAAFIILGSLKQRERVHTWNSLRHS